MVSVLLMQVFNDPRLSPLELFIFKPGDFPGSLPLVVTGDVLIDRQNEIQPPTKEEIAVCADRVRLHTPGFHAICCPAGTIISVPDLLRPSLIAKRVESIVLIPLGTRANKRVPVNGSPVRSVTARKFIHDAGIHLSPGRRLVCHQQHRIAGVSQIKSSVTEHRRRSVLVPPGMRADAIVIPVYFAARNLNAPG